MKDKEVKVKALDSIMRDLAPVDSILFAMGTEDTKDQERASLSEYLDSRIKETEKELSKSIKGKDRAMAVKDRHDYSFYHNEARIEQAVIKELQTIKEKFNL